MNGALCRRMRNPFPALLKVTAAGLVCTSRLVQQQCNQKFPSCHALCHQQRHYCESSQSTGFARSQRQYSRCMVKPAGSDYTAAMSNPPLTTDATDDEFHHLADNIKAWSRALGFQQTAICDTDLAGHADHYQRWLAAGHHGEMDYMARNTALRTDPEQLLPGTLRVISVRMDYLPLEEDSWSILAAGDMAYISRYALGRDYHKLIRRRLQQLADRITAALPSHQYRVFTDSAPILERGLAEKAGLGWIGKNSMLINSKAGSWFFLGEIYTNLPLPVDPPQETMHCGSCRACIDVCPTGAIIGDHVVDARRCISYLTIELRGSIPVELRPLIGNRIYGCDDCQLICPWNKFAATTAEADFQPRHNLHNIELLALLAWSESDFEQHTAGSPIRRIGYHCWLRNIAVAIGNGPYSEGAVVALKKRLGIAPLVDEHVQWALAQLATKKGVQKKGSEPIKIKRGQSPLKDYF